MAFKMKGWSGNQSPIRQNPKVNLKESIENLRQRIGIKPITHDPTTGKSTSGFGLTVDEKKAAKKAGMSEWQWKTSKSKSGTRANRWVTTEGDDKSYMITDNSVKTKDNRSGEVVEDFNINSTNYQRISEKIDNIEESQSEIKFEGNIPENVADYLQNYIKVHEENILDTNRDMDDMDIEYSIKQLELIKSDPLAYLNDKLDIYKRWHKEDIDEDGKNDFYYDEDVARMESLIKELKKK